MTHAGDGTKSALAQALEDAGREVSRAWIRACDEIVTRTGANPLTHALISESGNGIDAPLQRAWLVPQGEDWKPVRFPCVEMWPMADGAGLTVVVTPPEGDDRG